MAYEDIKLVPKVEYPAFSGALVVVAIWVLESWASVAVPGPVSAALVVVVGAVVGWFAPRR